jgi:murein L,D-transpeptidase YcbB/YkuD
MGEVDLPVEHPVRLPAGGVLEDGAPWRHRRQRLHHPAPADLPRLSSQAVRGGQRQLNKYAYGLVVDGIFGPATEAAVFDFQRQNGLTVDGVAGQNTWRTLEGGGGV